MLLKKQIGRGNFSLPLHSTRSSSCFSSSFWRHLERGPNSLLQCSQLLLKIITPPAAERYYSSLLNYTSQSQLHLMNLLFTLLIGFSSKDFWKSLRDNSQVSVRVRVYWRNCFVKIEESRKGRIMEPYNRFSKMKRKELADVSDEFSDFSLSSPARKIRRLVIFLLSSLNCFDFP